MCWEVSHTPSHTSPLANIHPFPSPRGYLPRSEIRDMVQKGLQDPRQYPSPHFCALTLGICVRSAFPLLVLSQKWPPGLPTGRMQIGPPWPLASCPQGFATPAGGGGGGDSSCCQVRRRGCSAGLRFLLTPGHLRAGSGPLAPIPLGSCRGWAADLSRYNHPEE